ncbi:MAG: FAD-dependent monooxygenase [Endozoicomonas sp.]|uniref:FAD-dependent monooxygenase n=1 Tax=Endozoicomonas sp. TaxID=1892382 RepID=UPI003D9BED00
MTFHYPIDERGVGSARGFIEELRTHFTQTRQGDGFADVFRSVEQEVILDLFKALSTDHAVQLIQSMRSDPALRHGMLQRFLTHILNNGLVNSDSIHGHTRDLVNPDHLLFLDLLEKAGVLDWLDVKRTDINGEELALSPSRLKANLEFEVRDFCHSSPAYRKLKDQLLRLDLTRLEKAVSQGSVPPEDVVKTVIEARKLMLDIDLGMGRRWDLEVLKSPDYWPSRDDHEAFLKLERIKFLKSPAIFRAQRQWLVEQHNKHKNFPNVVIEGAGPTGMMSAICQYQAGAKVQVVEKRNLQYDRVQVVRLNPKWMDMLRFYMGEEFDQLFTDPAHPSRVEGKGIIREDGFGEIVTFELEKAMQRELGKVEALNGARSHLDLTAQCELREIKGPEDGRGYRAVAHKLNTNTPVEFDDVDLVICAGGKSSPTRKRYLIAETVTEEGQYGVCTWKGEDMRDNQFGSFLDFRQMLVVDRGFKGSAISQMREQLRGFQRNQTVTADVARELGRKLDELDGKLLALQGQERAYQSRCFENRKLIYIGMEIPTVLQDSLREMSQYLEAQNVDRAQVKEVLTAMRMGWFQAVAGKYDLNAWTGATERHIDRKFAATFGVSQHRLQQNIVRNEQSGSRVYVTAAGDANCSPHFMRYSGLTGAREHILHDQEFTERLAAGATPEQMASYQDDLEEKSKNTADFVIGRGRVFLNPLDRLQKEYIDS